MRPDRPPGLHSTDAGRAGRARRRPRVALGALLALGLVLALPGRSSAAEAHDVDQVKAAFLFNFARFVEWPDHRFPRETSPIVIGVVGGRDFAEELRRVVEDRRVDGRSIEVREIAVPREARATHVVFVRESEDDRFAEILAALADEAVLTVGESPSFAREGGAICFVVEGDHLRFAVNLSGPERVGLRISSQLLKLATTVVDRP